MCQPLLITFVACILIFSMKRRSERKVQRRPNFEQNRRLIQSLLTVIVVFWLTCLPFTICTIRWIYPCKVRRCRRCPLLSLNFLKVLHYSNSFANPILYAIGLPGFRSTIKQTFCKRKRAMLQYLEEHRHLSPECQRDWNYRSYESITRLQISRT